MKNRRFENSRNGLVLAIFWVWSGPLNNPVILNSDLKDALIF